MFVLIGRAFVFVPAFVAPRGHVGSAPSLPDALVLPTRLLIFYAKVELLGFANRLNLATLLLGGALAGVFKNQTWLLLPPSSVCPLLQLLTRRKIIFLFSNLASS